MKPNPGRCIFRQEYLILLIQFGKEYSLQLYTHIYRDDYVKLHGLPIKYNTYVLWAQLDPMTTQII